MSHSEILKDAIVISETEQQKKNLERLLKQDKLLRKALSERKKVEPLQYTTHSDVGYGSAKPATTFNHIGYINPNLQGGK